MTASVRKSIIKQFHKAILREGMGEVSTQNVLISFKKILF